MGSIVGPGNGDWGLGLGLGIVACAPVSVPAWRLAFHGATENTKMRGGKARQQQCAVCAHVAGLPTRSEFLPHGPTERWQPWPPGCLTA